MSAVYLTVDQIIAINADQDGGVGVRDHDGVESAAHRPATEHFGVEAFPSIWLKAAAYAHGIAGTQHFYDGNKRTAWFTAVTFLRMNAFALPDVPTIEAELFINSVALDAWRADGPNATVEKAAEWFETKWRSRTVGPTRSDELEYVFLAAEVIETGRDNTATVHRLGLSGISVPSDARYPVDCQFHVVARFHPAGDDGHGHHIMAQIRPEVSVMKPPRHFVSVDEIPSALPTDHPQHHRTRLLPLLFTLGLSPSFYEAGPYRVEVFIDGAQVAELPFVVVDEEAVPDSPAGLF
ncbi:Fic family protein [uncultured Williamsia sp.]|uniref:type II toxin-antitoxin system death-on-curing family toxin n=1 Tax=uncultured Williamsia sp. TaxID=259311 RepID=UPI002626939B|nr:Fic family protein [uncultured Williamsia sp.]